MKIHPSQAAALPRQTQPQPLQPANNTESMQRDGSDGDFDSVCGDGWLRAGTVIAAEVVTEPE